MLAFETLEKFFHLSVYIRAFVIPVTMKIRDKIKNLRGEPDI